VRIAGHGYTLERPAARHGSARSTRASTGTLLALALLCALAMVVVWEAAAHVGSVRYRDASLLHDLAGADSPGFESIGNFVLHLLEPLLFTIWGTALVLIALARSRPRTAVAVAAVMGLAPLTSETLKPLLAVHHDVVGGTHVSPGSWPSGHSTAALALALSAIMVAAPRWRALVAVLGVGFAAFVGIDLLVLVWHMPSDVLGGYLMASLWAALALAGVRVSERLWPPSTAEPAQLA
jgi:membrane-associated phospholipid phosphatase